MKTLIPLISLGDTGPLGILNLPRLWLKLSLEAHGKLASGYSAMDHGFDQLVLDVLNINGKALREFIEQFSPTYLHFETWVREQQPDGKLSEVIIDQINVAINTYNHDDVTRKKIFETCGLNDKTCSFRDAIRLNQLQDWAAFHQAQLKA